MRDAQIEDAPGPSAHRHDNTLATRLYRTRDESVPTPAKQRDLGKSASLEAAPDDFGAGHRLTGYAMGQRRLDKENGGDKGEDDGTQRSLPRWMLYIRPAHRFQFMNIAAARPASFRYG